MIADIVGWVYCEHSHWEAHPDATPEETKWSNGRRIEIHCVAKTEAILRFHSYRGKSSLRVVSFVTFVSQGWRAYVDGEQTARVYCPLHNDIKHSSGRSYHVEG